LYFCGTKKYNAKTTAKNSKKAMELNIMVVDYITYSTGPVK